MPQFLFLLFAAIAVAGALAVVLLRSPIYNALALVVTLCALAALYVTLNAQFIAAIQIVVYAGAIMVLFLFVIMLLNARQESATDRHPQLKYFAFPIAAVLIFEAIAVIRGVTGPGPVSGTEADAVGNTASIGQALFSQYLLPFEITSALILMALVGAVALAKRDDRAAKSNEGSEA